MLNKFKGFIVNTGFIKSFINKSSFEKKITSNDI